MKDKMTLLQFAALPAHRLAGHNTASTYVYEFGHVPPDKKDFPNYGAFHSSEVPFALQSLHTWQRPWRPIDKTIEKMMSAYWVNFAKAGNPNATDLPRWQPYDHTDGHILKIGANTATKAGHLKAEFEFLD
ncbi:MAG: carboxylesterase family protein [Bacteroidota bacterium]